MKKFLLVFFILLAIGLHAQQISLSDVIKRSARAVEEVLSQRTMVAILNFSSPSETFSDYVIEELTGELVTGRKITIVDRRNLALISQEMNLQLSGEVSDESAQAIGKKLGAQSIVSGTLTNMGSYYRFRVRVINVETAAIQTQVSLDLRNDAQVSFLLSGSQLSVSPVNSGSTTSNGTTTEGIIVPGTNLADKLAWLQRSADSHNTYIVEVKANENIAPHTFEYKGAINVTVVLRGDNVNRTIRLRSNGTMFTIKPNITFILGNNITLQGHNGNKGSMVFVDGGTLRMNNGSTITGNAGGHIFWTNNSGGGGVTIFTGMFEMNGGTISGNTATWAGGGVFVGTGSNFYMNGGTISGNRAPCGGVVVLSGGNFTMDGGIITGNIAWGGGGVHLDGGTKGAVFTMRGGTITGNIAHGAGGGVLVGLGTFTKTGGTITGYNSDQINGNVVKDEVGNIIARSGHAVVVNENMRKETTAGPSVNLSYSNGKGTGGWDN